jgi:cytidylate kinase
MNKQIVLVIGGPGKSGSTTIAKMLSEYFQVEMVSGGSLFRSEAKRNGFNSVTEYLSQMSTSEIMEYDRFVDNKLKEYARRGNVLIESKVFAGIATKEDIDCSAKIWLNADIKIRVKRSVGKENIHNPIKRFLRKLEIKKNLIKRYNVDKSRYGELYGIEYDSPEKYNDLVIDNSGQTPEETFNLIINFLENAGIKKQK